MARDRTSETLNISEKPNFVDEQSFMNAREQELIDRGLGEEAPDLNDVEVRVQSYIVRIFSESEKPSSNSKKRTNERQVSNLLTMSIKIAYEKETNLSLFASN